MSRLYDALNRRAEPAEAAGGELWKALEREAAVAPDTPGSSEAAAEPEEVSIQEPAATQETDAAAPALLAPASLESRSKITLDKKARLLPHAVDPAVVEHYRRLRTKLLQQASAKNFRSLVVTSANPQEGKTVTVMNLALSFAMLPSFKILVVDGDLRRGTLGTWLGISEARAGFSNLIEGSACIEDAVLHPDDLPMSFLLRGNSKIPAAELLNSPELGRSIRSLSERFDLVLMDSPPVNILTDAQLLAASCDAVLLIARAFSTSRKAFEKASQDLAPFRVIGAVLNAGSVQASRYGYY
jgi:capsular exopolysaccharide synthesis family protein